MNRRRHARTKKRISCALLSGGRRYSGVVIDCSPQGLFVQTSAKLAPGTIVEVELGVSTREEPLLMQARVARQKLVPPELRSVAQGGLGLQIDLPPQAYLEFYAELTRTELPTGAKVETPSEPSKHATSTKPTKLEKLRRLHKVAPPATSKLRYRVRLAQIAGSRSRTIDVQCSTLNEAETAALETVGDGWKVIKIEPA